MNQLQYTPHTLPIQINGMGLISFYIEIVWGN